MTQPFDKFFVQVGIGTNRKLRRLPVAQRWTFVAGVLALAAQSPMRGALLIADGHPVTAEDVAAEASVTLQQARAALRALRELGMIEQDDDGIEWVHDWDKLNPDPRPSDSPEATRERKRRERDRRRNPNSHAHVTRDTPVTSRPSEPRDISESHDPEEEEKVEAPPSIPPLRGGRQRDRQSAEREMADFAAKHFPGVASGLIDYHAARLRSFDIPATVAALRHVLDQEAAAA